MTDIGAIDLLASISGIGDYDQLRNEIVDIEIDSIRVPVLSLPAIIKNKRAARRDKDLAALPHIEATLRLRESAAERDGEPNLQDAPRQQGQGTDDSNQ